MYSDIFQLLKSIAPFCDEDFEKYTSYLKAVELKKNEYFSKSGRITDRIGFVNSGLLRSFYSIKDKETTTFFLQPGSMATAMLSFIQMKPAIENIQAIEPSELLVINRKNLYKLYDGNWKWQQVGRILIEEYYIKLEKRSIELQSLSAKERYQRFIEEFPDVIKVAPLNQIASYLGISPETLSRLRKSLL